MGDSALAVSWSIVLFDYDHQMPVGMTKFLMAGANFYSDPGRVRRRALSMGYSHPESVVGWRTRCYQPRGIKERIERRFSVRITEWETDLDKIEGCNGVFFQAYNRGDHAE